MIAIGLILLLVAALAWGGFAMQKFKGGRLDKAPFVKTGDAASKGAAVANTRTNPREPFNPFHHRNE